MTVPGGDGPGDDGSLVRSLPDGVIPLAEAMVEGIPLVVEPLQTDSEGSDQSEPTAENRDRGSILRRLLAAPLRLEDDWPDPNEPVEVGDGWIHPETLAEDRPLFEALLDRYRLDGSEAVALACQEARLPVSPYRSPGSGPRVLRTITDHLVCPTGPTEAITADLRGFRVVDLTTHWAGPLATMLLATAGASVIKIDPECRPDGFRDRPCLYQELNSRKDVVDCDLRTEAGRDRFEALVSEADLLVESFSRRVMPNLGYPVAELRTGNSRLNTISIKPFALGTPEADWLAYGPGVHAASGLGFADQANPGELQPIPSPAPVAYPDFLTGIAAYAAAFRLLTSTDGTRPVRVGRHVEIPMAEVLEPLVDRLFGQPTSANEPTFAAR